MRKHITSTLWIVLFVLAAGNLLAQPSLPQAPTPFGGLELLLAAGAAYGVKKAVDKRKQNQ